MQMTPSCTSFTWDALDSQALGSHDMKIKHVNIGCGLGTHDTVYYAVQSQVICSSSVSVFVLHQQPHTTAKQHHLP